MLILCYNRRKLRNYKREAILNFRNNAFLVVGFSFLVTSSVIAAECESTVIADEKTEVFGQEHIEIDCRFISGTVEFPIIYQFIQDGGPVDQRISFFPESDEKQGFKIKSPPETWCTDADGIAVVDAEINCDTTVGNHLYWLESGSYKSEKTAISVLK